MRRAAVGVDVGGTKALMLAQGQELGGGVITHRVETGPVARPNMLLLGRYTRGGRLRLVVRSTPLPLALRDEIGPLLTPAGPGHPWWKMRLTVSWGSREPLSFTCVEPEIVVEFLGDTAVDAGRWRHAVRAQRPRSDLTAEDVDHIE
ncbi:hypothetical protein [Streptomyces sp. MS2.AVA.5]|uniref:Uncharacterized protein n=1 Tax=Streptomyces achmelvichensis TaxID=3134111 RepID=A0ACC6Q7S8_9ACTN